MEVGYSLLNAWVEFWWKLWTELSKPNFTTISFSILSLFELRRPKLIYYLKSLWGSLLVSFLIEMVEFFNAMIKSIVLRQILDEVDLILFVLPIEVKKNVNFLKCLVYWMLKSANQWRYSIYPSVSYWTKYVRAFSIHL